ncbi:MBL fold metallo-hydrolase [Patescibacteria group bacterium]|nr:MBL fold metallo-hydrolase [Patescibacteria group bacterium]MBU1868143.1 MBL fold metallo-hydrolase [Patescibacteria group bacterium]
MDLRRLSDKTNDFLFTKITYQRFLFALVFIALFIWLAIFTWPNRELHLYFLAVGQGDSVFIRTPDNYKILIDGGPDLTILEKLSAALPFYDRELDLVVLTHPHADHVNGLSAVLAKYKVDKVIYNPVPYKSSQYQLFKDKVKELGIKAETFTKGQVIEFGDGVKLTCFWPLGQETFAELSDVNAASIVVLAQYGEFSALLTGDAEFSQIPQLESQAWPRVQVLKVPHQGSKGAVTEKVLAQLKPDLAVVSVGENKFGHPVKSEIEKLQTCGSEIVRTDLVGTIEVVTNGKRWYYVIEKWK